MPCDECRKLQEEETNAWQSLQKQRTMNQQMHFRGKEAKGVEQKLERSYNLAYAKNRLHKGRFHQDAGHQVRIEDLNIFVRSGRTRP